MKKTSYKLTDEERLSEMAAYGVIQNFAHAAGYDSCAIFHGENTVMLVGKSPSYWLSNMMWPIQKMRSAELPKYQSSLLECITADTWQEALKKVYSCIAEGYGIMVKDAVIDIDSDEAAVLTLECAKLGI